MTATATSRNGAAGARQSDRSRLEPPPGTRRRPVRALVLLVVAVVCALGFAVTLSAAGQREAVLALARDVPAGGVIEAGDLTVVEISADDRLRPIAGAQRSRIVGRTATWSLAAGTLLTEAHLAEPPGPGPDESVVALRLKGARVAPTSLRPGQRVQVVQTTSPIAADVVEAGPVELGTVLTEGRVLSIERSDSAEASVELSVAVAEAVAPAVAGAAAADLVSVVVVSPAT
ncbi:MAG TPA: SAF domain-containing protein [Acidimicrobiales bacterium]|nr:SAF domain-containing protein [Acidimicrobiales bacterium]